MLAVNRHNYNALAYLAAMASLGDRVREARRGAKLSQEELARRVGIKQPTIAAIESGDIKETAHIVKIALATGYSAYWLENGKGAKKLGFQEALALSEDEQRAAAAFIQQWRQAKRA